MMIRTGSGTGRESVDVQDGKEERICGQDAVPAGPKTTTMAAQTRQRLPSRFPGQVILPHYLHHIDLAK